MCLLQNGVTSAAAFLGFGFGFGDAQARRFGSCMFGARIQFAADIRLGELAESLRGLRQLVADLARVEPPQHVP